ncbi:MAG TPA: (d)CMP kinase [Gemmata sp.]|nr:(d)CMP kinase [Gemmata sp.]
MIITIDGPAASGKGTAAKGIAERLGFEYLDTGAMYRAVALAAIRGRISCDDRLGVAGILSQITLEMPPGRVILNGDDVTEPIRSPELSQGASKVAEIPAVRSFLIPQQRQIASGRNIICEGRDQGTVVFPDAPLKFFITADVRTRAERRLQQHKKQGIETTMETEIAELIERDKRDTEREVGPLREPPDAVHIDTTHLTAAELLNRLEEDIRKCLPAQP